MTALSARPVRISAVSAALEHSVLASRLNSCARKSSRRPTGSDDFEKLAGRLDMGPQPVDLLLDVGTRREDGGLLVEPLGIEGETGVDEAGHLLGQPAADQLSHPALPLPRLGHQACDLRQLTLEHAFELGALGPLHGAQAPEHLLGAGHHRGIAGGDLALVALGLAELDDTGQPQHPFDRRRRRAERRREVAADPQELRQHRVIDPDRTRPQLVPELQRHLHGTAANMPPGPLAQLRLQRLEPVRQPEPDLERLAIDGARLPMPARAPRLAIDPGKAGHAGDGHLNSAAA